MCHQYDKIADRRARLLFSCPQLVLPCHMSCVSDDGHCLPLCPPLIKDDLIIVPSSRYKRKPMMTAVIIQFIILSNTNNTNNNKTSYHHQHELLSDPRHPHDQPLVRRFCPTSERTTNGWVTGTDAGRDDGRRNGWWSSCHASGSYGWWRWTSCRWWQHDDGMMNDLIPPIDLIKSHNHSPSNPVKCILMCASAKASRVQLEWIRDSI